MAGTVDVFFYGTFMDPDELRRKGLNPAEPRRACVSGMALQIGDRAALVPAPDMYVYGLVMGLTHAELGRLYADAGVAAYRPEAVVAGLADGSIIPALCLNLPFGNLVRSPNRDYALKLRAVAEKMGLPRSYVEAIR